MADSKSPIICVTCQRALPDDLNADDSPRYFAQSPLLPRRDDDYDFLTESVRITEFINAIGEALVFSEKEISDETYNSLFDLITELSAEALRRMKLARDAIEERWKCDHGHNDPTRQEGRA
jgi:hypothetical protein